MKDVLAAFFERYTRVVPSDGEYIGEDGLFYCKKCNTPTQCRIRVGGMERIVSCMCRCRKEDQEAYEKKLEETSRRNRVMSLKAREYRKRRYSAGHSIQRMTVR